ncbi:urea ABC transporter permease subunit UrtB [Bartonella sp. HY329]|nr:MULTISPECIES: urea ABC transporter permease subunit UrtB [unclassified Bartonella]UXM95807.1 urea ABC transporter permease subunit UrtB [Bartonella sp. HY329]UXN10132.1 urea ABC transporter permease subunit UrtB [Bartonella sp. HY328]
MFSLFRSLLGVLRLCLGFLAVFLMPIFITNGFAQNSDAQVAMDLRRLVNALGEGSFNEKSKAISDLASLNDPQIDLVLNAMNEGRLAVQNSNKSVVILDSRDGKIHAIDALTNADFGVQATASYKKIALNNRLRRDLGAAIGQRTLMSDVLSKRQEAAANMLRNRDIANLPLLDKAIAQETDLQALTLMQQARAATIINTDIAIEQKIAAIEVIESLPARDAIAFLTPLATDQNLVGKKARTALSAMEQKLQFQAAGQNVIYGLSLGSVLLLAAIGLAITFGVMGVINMAHGEMVMIGAYSTYLVQSLIKQHMTVLNEWSILIALPIAFLITGAIGVLLERSVIRWLYGRTLETLLATWGVSLILQQAIRSMFGASNREVASPSWLSGNYEIWGMSITASRLWIIAFALIVFFSLLLLMKRSFFGLQMRAVTQNRAMANVMGIRTPWVDALTFGLGSGIAGLAGVALTQIDNVSPNLGQGYIIDSFMVVVFGGVGNLWGTLVSAFTLGIANKLLEPWVGAVLGKILLLVFIILFIQKRPRGLFAQKGRAVEA